MKLRTHGLLAIAAILSACATDPTWTRLVPPSRVAYEANGCPAYTIDDAAPLSQWKKVGDFWDEDACQGTPFQVAELKGQKELSREKTRAKAEAGDQDSIKIAKCWDDKDYMSWTAPASSSLIGHEWNSNRYACVQKDDSRLTASTGVDGTARVAGK